MSLKNTALGTEDAEPNIADAYWDTWTTTATRSMKSEADILEVIILVLTKALLEIQS